MSRHKEFDKDEALQKAMEVFWSRGYEAASMQSLIRHMGINRQSLYDTFGDKHALYLQALDRYCEVENRRLLDLLERGSSVKRAVRELFARVVEGSLRGGERRGCLMGNAMSELAGRCKKTAARTATNMVTIEDALYRALLRGRKKGELKAVHDPRAVARFLFTNLQGLALVAKAAPDRRTLEDVVKVTMSVVE